jgi:hypothetical protein
MALSTLNTSLPALEDLTTLNPRPSSPRPRPIPKTPKNKIDSRLIRDIRRDILLLRELNDYDNDDEVENTYERIAVIILRRYKKKIT